MIQVSTHLFGSIDGYQTLAKSGDVTELEERALSIFGFGSPHSPQEIEQLQHRPCVAGQPLPGGRFAITRLFPGGPDVAGRETVERRSIIFTAQQWKSVVQCDVESLVADDHAFQRDAFVNASTHSVQVRDSDDLLPKAGELERHLYDILLSTPRHNSCALLPDELANRRALMRLLKLLPAQDACQLSWGLGLFAATPGVRIATASSSAPATPHARWPSLTGQLAHPNKVATLGMSLDTRATTRDIAIEPKNTRMSLRQLFDEYLAWIIVICVLLFIALGYFIFASRPQKLIRPLPANVMQAPTPPTEITKLEIPNTVVPETKQVATEPADSQDTSATATATATTSNYSSSPSAAKPTPAPGGEVQPSTLPSTPSEINQAPSTPTAPQTDSPMSEPVNAFTENSIFWFEARKLFDIAHPPAPTDLTLLAQWVSMTKLQVKDLNDLEKKIIDVAGTMNFKKILFGKSVDVLNLKNQDEANQIFNALLLILAECDILSAKAAIQNHLASPLDFKNKSEIEKQIGELDFPPVMRRWVEKIGTTMPARDFIQNNLDSNIRELKGNKQFPIKQIEIPASRPKSLP